MMAKKISMKKKDLVEKLTKLFGSYLAKLIAKDILK